MMRVLLRYWRLLRAQVRASALALLQYRFDFFADGALEILWALTALVPLFVVFGTRESVAGWSFGEALLVTGWFILLQGILEGAINPSLTSVVEHIRTGTLDFVLLKPADAQFLVSTARFQPWRATNIITAVVVFVYAFRLLGRPPSPGGLIAALFLLFSSTLLLYSLWILTVSAAFYVVKIDNLSVLFSSIFDAARWPSTIFRGVVSFVFTFVVPLALMTTYPALSMLGKLRASTFVLAFVGSVLFAALARLVWLGSIGKYTSASS